VIRSPSAQPKEPPNKWEGVREVRRDGRREEGQEMGEEKLSGNQSWMQAGREEGKEGREREMGRTEEGKIMRDPDDGHGEALVRERPQGDIHTTKAL